MCILSFGNNCEVVKKNGNKGHSFPASTTVVGFKALQVKFDIIIFNSIIQYYNLLKVEK